MSAASVSLWHEGTLLARDDCDSLPATIVAADSFLVTEGAALALDLHRSRFLSAMPGEAKSALRAADFWDVAIAEIPRSGDWFPRVELRTQLERPQLLLRMREAPVRRVSVALANHLGRDPRTAPRVKGPDLEAMTRLRTEAQVRGADEAVLVTREGYIAEGSTTCLAWWRGDNLCVPAPDIPRIDGVTVRSLVTLATALGITVQHERVRPSELDGHEVWALNALHGIRIVTAWIDGPDTAEQPGRLTAWRSRLDALRRPLPAGSAT